MANSVTKLWKLCALAASREALLLDPVYTGRAMAGLVSQARRGVIEPGQKVLFLHTGGLPGLFAYEEKIRNWEVWIRNFRDNILRLSSR